MELGLALYVGIYATTIRCDRCAIGLNNPDASGRMISRNHLAIPLGLDVGIHIARLTGRSCNLTVRSDGRRPRFLEQNGCYNGAGNADFTCISDGSRVQGGYGPGV